MKLHYISNSCLVVDHGSVCLVIDPWFTGSAYMGHWHLFPRPVDLSIPLLESQGLTEGLR